MKKKISLSIATIALAGLITGCGSSSSSSSSNSNNNTTSNNQTPTTQNQKSVKAVDGYIIGANVCDTKGVCSTTDDNGTATANFADTALSATGGYIDVNGNGKIDDSDIKLPDTFTLKTPAGKSVISPITDLIANGANPAKLAEVLGVNEADLYKDPIATNNVDLAKAIQIVYALKTENKESDLVGKVNNYTGAVQSDLPDFNAAPATNTPKKEDTNKTKVNSDLPDFSKVVKSDLPDFSNSNTVTTSEKNTTTAAPATKGSLALFANLASSVASGEAKTLITAVMASTATTPLGLEQEIAETKKDLIKTEEATAQTVENNATAENTQSAETNTTETAQNSAQAEETNTTAENTQSTETNTTENTQENSTPSSNVKSDLPDFS